VIGLLRDPLTRELLGPPGLCDRKMINRDPEIVRGVGGFFRGVSPGLICESRHKSTCSVLCSRDRKGNCVISRNCALDGAPSRFDPALAIPGRNE
jgi:hypothetical protein